jgi:hypothetical protein
MIKGCTQFLLLIFCFITQHAFGQQCGYDFYNLFILDIHRAGETRQANDIEVYLCGVDSTELQKIAPNSERKIGKKKEFPRAEDYFITLISNRVKPDASPPVYFAKVIDGSNTTFHRLFYEKSLNICFNHPHSNHPIYKDRTMIQEDGNPFSPIEIVLSEKRNKTKINYPLEQVFFRYHFKEDQTDRLQHRSSELTLEYVDVYDYRSMNKVAKLKPSKNFTFASKNRHLYLEAADVFQDNPATIKDIIITTGVINFDHQLWSDIYKEFFLFDVKNQTYYKDDALSSLPNIFINNEGKLLRTDYVIKDKYLITHHLQFNQHSWELIKTEEREIYLPQKGYSNSASEIIAEPAQCLCALESTSVLLPLVVATDSIGKYQNVEYAFILQNRCNRKIALK